MDKLGQITRVEKQPATNADYCKQHYARHCEQYFGRQFHTPIFARRLAPYFPIVHEGRGIANSRRETAIYPTTLVPDSISPIMAFYKRWCVELAGKLRL